VASQNDSTTEFAQLLLRVIEEGKRTGTQKLVTLLAIGNALERATDSADGTVPDALPIATVADEVILVMWQQVAPFVPLDGGEPVRLRQMRPNGRGAYTFFDATLRAHQAAEQLEHPTWPEFVVAEPQFVAGLRHEVIRALVKNPLPRLQTFTSGPFEFLYRWPWGPDKSPTTVSTKQNRPEPVVEFLPGRAELLLAFAPMVRPLVEATFVSDIARYNQMDRAENALRDHLFGSARIAFPTKLRDQLRELQDGRCFYEPDGPAVPASKLHVDHFVPWIRHPNNAAENLVVAHGSCNGSKNDMFAAADHLSRWAGGIGARRDVGTELGFSHTTVFSDPVRSVGIARRGYQLLPDGFPLWRAHQPGAGRVTEPLTDVSRTVVEQALQGIAPTS
jgi:hypothetical protein